MVLPNPDFKATTSTSIRLSPDGSNSATDYELTNHCPEVFRTLMDIEKVNADDYLLSIYGNETIRKIASPWRNSSPFSLSQDKKFVIKTIKKSEMKMFLDILPNYYSHVRKYPHTLLIRIFGLHVIKPSEGPKVRFVVMGNIIRSNLSMHKCFSLKGSTQGRGSNKIGVDDSVVLKDSDLDLCFQLDRPTRNQLMEQIMHDCDFLEGLGVMDYSLILGMHICRISSSDLQSSRGSLDGRSRRSDVEPALVDGMRSRRSDSRSSLQSDCSDVQDLNAPLSEMQCLTNEAEAINRLGVRISARAVRVQKIEGGAVTLFRPLQGGGSSSSNKDQEPMEVVLYFGITEFLQGFNMSKRVERVFKSFQYDSQSISAVNPNFYSTRFQDFLSKVFIEDTFL